MIYAYSELYLSDAKSNLAVYFDYGVNACGYSLKEMADAFVVSGYAKYFAKGHPGFVCGKSGVELAREAIEKVYAKIVEVEYSHSLQASPQYWLGWALAEYQWYTSRGFDEIFYSIDLNEILAMYRVYHEMDISHFVEDLDKRINEASSMTHLQSRRRACGLSQAQLAKRSGVNIRNIRAYEQAPEAINKATGINLYRLANALYCSVEDLLEIPTLAMAENKI